ncbi:MAG: hypothetical protein H0W89_07220 [Candidatus Levybacteria bacterium]|nr:hypothetical protein [Candidatus Levybacteria bacterium]
MNMFERKNDRETEQPGGLRLKITGKSEGWSSEVARNGDSYYINPFTGLAIVAGGKGIESAAIDASKIVVSSIRTSLTGLNTSDLNEAGAVMREALKEAHVRTKSEAPIGKASVTAVKVIDTTDGRKAVIGSIGKTRAYLLRDGEIELLTRDHGVNIKEKHTNTLGEEINLEEAVIEAMDNIRTSDDLRAFKQTKFGSFSGRYFWKYRNLVGFAVGGVIPDHIGVYEVPLQAGDKIVVVSSGMQNLSRAELTQSLNEKSPNPAEAVVASAAAIAVDRQNTRSFPANITTVVMEIQEREKKVKEYQLGGGDELRLDYIGKPYTIVLPDANTLRIGKPTDMGFTDSGVGSYVLVNDQEFTDTQGQSGAIWVPDESFYFIGQSGGETKWQIHRGEKASQLKICRRGDQLTFKDLHSREGFTIVQPLRD